jgi:peptide deformylase
MLVLVKESDPILKQIAAPWDFDQHDNAEETERKMLAIMKANNGIGLAGNQVGILRRIFVIQLQNGHEIGCFNPRILNGDNSNITGNEGCLSFPDLWLKVSRHNKITAAYLDNTGTEHIIELEGIDSRCFQHELDHLDGITFTEHVSNLKLAFARKKQLQRKRDGRTK